LQAFYTDVAKVDRNVAHVVMVVHVCCKLLFLMFHLFFRHTLQVYLSGCCICFHTYDASVLCGCCVCLQWFQGFLGVFASFQTHVLFVFRRMLQLLYLDVSNLHRVLHLPSRLSVVRLGVRRRKAKAVPTGPGGSHALAGGCSRRDVGQQAWDSRRGAATRASG
jgi:hypothetical protein